jgi:hypothetical protein
VPGSRHPLMVNGVPVVTAPRGVDVLVAEQLGTALSRTATRRHAMIVVNMTRTRSCDSAGLIVLV